MSTAAYAVRTAVAAALVADVPLLAALGGAPADPHVFSRRKPEGHPARRYVVLGEPSEGDASTFDADGNAGVLRLHLWADPTLVLEGEAEPRSAEELYAHVERILNFRPLTLEGHVQHVGATELSIVLDDPSGMEHGVVAYRAVTEATA